MTVFRTNLKRGHKFFISGAMFGFCMARTIACVMRIVWAIKPQSVSVAIAASLFVAVGDVIGYIVNLNFAQRIIRALHPKVGWHPAFKIAFIAVYSLIAVSMALLISFTVYSFYTLNPGKRRTARDFQLYGASYFATVALLPIPLVLGALATPRTLVDDFGTGSFRNKIIIVLSGTTALALGAWFRAGTAYMNPRPATDPAPYQSKACFYIFYFTLEFLVIWGYLVARIDQRFYVPDKSKGPGDYSRFAGYEKEVDHTAPVNINGEVVYPICEGPVVR